MFHTDLTPPSINQETIDCYVAKGKRERSRVIVEMVKGLFTASEPRRHAASGRPA